MRIAAALLLVVLNAAVVHANSIDADQMLGTWKADGAQGRISGPIVISATQVSWTSEDGHRCVDRYYITSRFEGASFPGGPISTDQAADAYTTFELALEPQSCEREIRSFTISLTSESSDRAHFAALSAERTAQAYGAMHRVAATSAAQAPADSPPFTPDEIAIYRDFLLHYPEHPSEMIGMQAYTTRFVEAYAFGDEPNPPKLNLETPAYSARQLPPEVLELTTEAAVTQRATAQGQVIYPNLENRLKLSEIAFDLKHEHAALFYSSMQGKGGTSGTVVYAKHNGQWQREGRIWNSRIA